MGHDEAAETVWRVMKTREQNANKTVLLLLHIFMCLLWLLSETVMLGHFGCGI